MFVYIDIYIVWKDDDISHSYKKKDLSDRAMREIVEEKRNE
jgi:hypothetical protein